MPIIVPATPGSELAKTLRVIAEGEAAERIQFKVIETGGLTIKSEVQRSNPTATAGCLEQNCLLRRIEPGIGRKFPQFWGPVPTGMWTVSRRRGVLYQRDKQKPIKERACGQV